MFQWLRSLWRNDLPKRSEWPVPPGKRLYAIGDIHGELTLAQALVEMIAEDNALRRPAETHLIFLGDYIDRGPGSKAVLEWLSTSPPDFATCHFIRGNHEDAFLSVLKGDESELAGWRRYGGRETLLSYGISDKAVAMGGPMLRNDLRANVPDHHVQFLEGLIDSVVIGDFIFVHAGIRPGVPLEQQDPRDLTWIRDEFLTSNADHGKIIVHGHTISSDVEIRHNRIGIDTGAYATGRLTALCLEGQQRWFLQTRPTVHQSAQDSDESPVDSAMRR